MSFINSNIWRSFYTTIRIIWLLKTFLALYENVFITLTTEVNILIDLGLWSFKLDSDVFLWW